MKTFKLAVDSEKDRLDTFCGRHLPEISREKIKNAIKDGCCKVDGQVCQTPGKRLTPGQVVEMSMPEAINPLEAEDGNLELLWHDQYMAILNKPAGLTVHPCPSCPEHTLVNLLLAHFPALKTQEGPRPGIVHRLDKGTSGILAVALLESARLKLSNTFAEREAHKEYLALVYGATEPCGSLNMPIGRHPTLKTRQAIVPLAKGGKEAATDYTTLYTDPERRFSLLMVRIHTGRTHQIRVHMSHIGHPLVGDALYGRHDSFSPRHMLHAWKLSLPHPETGETISCSCPPPHDFLKAALALSQSMRRIVITGVPGCGKSALAGILAKMGLPVWSADEAVARQYQKDQDGWIFLQGRYGGRFTEGCHDVDRKALFAAMQESPSMRREVEETIHALVRHDLAVFWQKAEASAAKTAVAEIPLYFETGMSQSPEQLSVGVYCADEIRKERLAKNRNWDEDTIARLDSWQWAQDKKMAACDFVVDNSRDEKKLAAAAEDLLKTIEIVYRQKEARLAESLIQIFNDKQSIA